MTRTSIISAALTLAILPTGGHAADCSTVYANASRYSNGTVFYNSDQGFSVVSSSNAMKGMIGSSVYLLRKGIDRRSAGGVLVVKTAVPKADQSPSQVTLMTRFTKKQITACRKNADLRKRLGETFGRTVTYEQFQEYVHNPRATASLPSEVRRLIDKMHFAYKGSIDIGNLCDKMTNSGGNRAQNSLVKSQTGRTTVLYRYARLAAGTRLFSTGVADDSYDWKVRMIPYDRNPNVDSSTICIVITAPELSKAKLLRINDLEERQRDVKRDSWFYDNRHAGDREYDVE